MNDLVPLSIVKNHTALSDLFLSSSLGDFDALSGKGEARQLMGLPRVKESSVKSYERRKTKKISKIKRGKHSE